MMMTTVPAVLHYRGGVTEAVQTSPEIARDRDSVKVIGSAGTEADIRLSELKAIFFLRTRPLMDGEASAEGTLLSVEFRDGEVIRGISSEYTPQRSGFFLFPLDRSKNDRVFVVNSAIASIEVEKF